MRISDWSSDVCSSDLLAVICKICVTEGVKKGANAKDAAIVAGVLEREGAHLLVLSGGMNVESPWAIFGSPMPAEAVSSIQNTVVRLAAKMMRLVEPKISFHELYLREHYKNVRAAVKIARTSAVEGKCVSVRVVRGVRLLFNKNTERKLTTKK